MLELAGRAVRQKITKVFNDPSKGERLGMPAVDLAAGVIMQARMDLLPDWAQALHARPDGLPRPLVRGGAMSTARFLRWAFDGSPNRRVRPRDVTEF